MAPRNGAGGEDRITALGGVLLISPPGSAAFPLLSPSPFLHRGAMPLLPNLQSPARGLLRRQDEEVRLPHGLVGIERNRLAPGAQIGEVPREQQRPRVGFLQPV